MLITPTAVHAHGTDPDNAITVIIANVLLLILAEQHRQS